MRTIRKSLIRYNQSQRIGIFLLIAALIGIEVFALIVKPKNEPTHSANFSEEIIAMQKQINEADVVANLTAFDPNELGLAEWEKLGFSEKQANTILKYKFSLGGYFEDAAQIKDCYVISAKKFAEIEPYIEIKPKSKNLNQRHIHSEFETISIPYQKFNPNNYTQKDWEKIGFSKKQATTILKYKQSLGGKFHNLEQIKACFVISDEKFREMKPYIMLESSKIQTTSENPGTIQILEEEPSSEGAEQSEISGVIQVLED